MEAWLNFWKYLCIIGVVGYLVTVAYMVPWGARDIFRLFRKLRERGEKKQ